MNRQVRYAIGIAMIVGPLAAYYAIPLFLAVISLGELCPYSPSGTSLCARSTTSAQTVELPPSAQTFLDEPIEAKLCTKPGIRYAGTTAQGAEVCFTLTQDRRSWVEIGFRFDRASGCAHEGADYATGKTYVEGPGALTGPDRITVGGFEATIRGAQASGVLADSEICGDKKFEWTARRTP